MENNKPQVNSPQLPQQQVQQLSIRSILNDNPPQIQEIAKTDYEGLKVSVISVLSGHNKNMNQFLHLRVDQLSDIADIIISQYPTLCMDDIRLCMLKGIKGEYGDVKAFDVLVICGWLTKYSEERRLAMLHKPIVFEKKEEKPPIPMPDDIRQILSKSEKDKLIKFKAEVDENEENEFLFGPTPKDKKEIPPLKPSEVEEEGWRIFDILRSGAWIEFRGRNYNQDEWTHYFFYTVYRDDEMYKEALDLVDQKIEQRKKPGKQSK